MNEPTHIIDKVFLEVNTSSQKTAYFIKDNISSFLESELFPELEVILEKYDVKEAVIRLDELHLDVEFDKWENNALLKSEIKEAFRKKLEHVLPSIQSTEDTETHTKKLSPEENRKQVFLFFLENGRLPWYAKEEHIRDISREDFWKESLENEQFAEKLKNVLATVNFSTRRFVLQFPEKMVFQFLNSQNKDFNKAGIRKLVELTKQFSPPNHNLFLQWMVEFIVSENELTRKIHLHKLRQIISKKKITSADKRFKTGIIQLLRKIYPDFPKDEDWSTIYESGEIEIFPEKTKDKSDNSIDKSEDAAESVWKNEDELFVGNAGLILLHPFFKSFFNEFDFLDESGQILNNKKELAVQALHFIATGSEDFFEGNLLFEKFLCNVPQKWPISRESLLNEQIKNEAEALLNAAIKHWPALKNTSTNGLRQNFLQRNGKLIQNGENYRLLVERKTQDILLERISWNISVVKLPWMKNLLHVEW
ncbi:MAG TPA: contractile injection system tape measure protein [Tangfeifania sp.]|nr:contractile injection system tape measure protein [Tangfeifania sp.]